MTDEAGRKRLEAEQLKQSNAEADALQHKQALAAAIAYDVTKPGIERLRRSQAMANTPEAWARRNDWDVFNG